jgi:hypothetical protein
LQIVALTTSASGLALASLLIALVLLRILDVPWNAKTLPRLVLFALLPYCAGSLIVSIVSLFLDRDAKSLAALLLGTLATIASVIALFVIVVTAVAGHPL